MGKLNWKPGNMLYPLPVVMVSVRHNNLNNIITVAWTGVINTNPPMVYISVRPERYSYEIIEKSKEFVINLTNEELAYATDWCGVKSGKLVNKFKEMKLTAVKAPNVNAPMIDESPLCIECKVVEIKELGSHDMFIAEVVNVVGEDSYLQENGQLDMAAMNLLAYNHGQYFDVTNPRGFFGWSIRKKKKLKRDIK